MRHDEQIRLGRRLLAHLDAGTTDTAPIYRNPVANYTCPERLRREWRVLFHGLPLLAALSCQMPRPGDYLTHDDAGVPILLVRGKDGAVNAFLNVCRHRGARVAEGAGHVRRLFVCPYHAWSYDTAGRLVGLPDRRSFDGLDRACHGLKPLPCEERDGMIWVCARPDGSLDLDRHLGGLGPELAGYGLGGHHHYATRVLRPRINWKTVIDTFLEPYHLAALHKETVAPIFFGNLCLCDRFGHNLRETLARRGIVELRARPEAEWNLLPHTAILYVLFPNTVLVVQIDHIEIWRVYPAGDAVDRSVVHLDFYIPEPAETDKARRHWDRNLDLAIRTVDSEDFPTGEGIQFGLASGAQDHLVYGRNEPALSLYERTITETLDRAAGAPAGPA